MYIGYIPIFDFDIFLFALLTRVNLLGRKKTHQINQNFGTVCHTEVCLTFSRLAAKLSEIIAKFRGRSHIQGMGLQCIFVTI